MTAKIHRGILFSLMTAMLNIQKSPSAYHANGQIIRILLFLNSIPVNHPDIFLAVDNHMVCHADPQLFVKLCDRSMTSDCRPASSYFHSSGI